MRLALIILSLVLGACDPVAAPPESQGLGEQNTYRVAGELKSANPKYFGPPVVGRSWHYTIAFMAPDGAAIKAGEPMLRFDTQELQNKLRDRTNSLNEKQKELENEIAVSHEKLADLKLTIEEARAQRDKAVLKANIPESLLARRDYLDYQLVLEQSDLTLQLRQAELDKEKKIQATEQNILDREIGILKVKIERLKEYIRSMMIVAPGDGVVIHVADRKNSKPTVGETVGRGTHVIEFPDLTQLEVHLEIPERELARVAAGQAVRFSLDAVPERRFEGQITELASVIRTKSVNQPMRIFDARVILENPDPELMRPGMSITAEIQIGEEG